MDTLSFTKEEKICNGEHIIYLTVVLDKLVNHM